MALPDLPDSVYAPEQLKSCALELEKLMAWRQRQDVKAKTGVPQDAGLDFQVSDLLQEWLGKAEMIARANVEQMEQCHHQLMVWLKQPVTHVTFPTPAPSSTKKAVVKWFRAEISPNALVKFSVNRNVVGGMVVRTPGKIFDFSFRRQLLRNKDRIPAILQGLTQSQGAAHV